MRITLNGEVRDLEGVVTVADLLERLRADGMPPGACAVELNRQLVPRRDHHDRQLSEGDAIEIVTLVGGG